MRKLENEEISELENWKMRKLVNEVEATRKVLAERINFAKGASHIGSTSHTGSTSRIGSVSHTGRIFGKVYTPKSDISELSEGNGRFQKRVGRDFGEKRL